MYFSCVKSPTVLCLQAVNKLGESVLDIAGDFGKSLQASANGEIDIDDVW